jgi:CubicO group peptidase (beta-lactamase class C family)
MSTAVGGYAASHYTAVAEAFQENFDGLGDVGAAFAAYQDGELVVDIWGGAADSKRDVPWGQDTMALLFSGTKALVGLCLLMLAERGQLDLDAPVARYWPQFAAAGKARVTVAELASHQARLPAVRMPLSEDDLLDPARMAALLAAQPQEKDPRAQFAYHALTYGWLCGEIVRRVDGRTVGEFFADEVAGPLELELWIGIDAAIEGRVARLEYAPDWGGASPVSSDADDDLKAAVWANPPLFPAPEMPWNRPSWHQAQIPASNAIGTARSVARFYGCLACGGELDGVRLLKTATLDKGTRQLSGGNDPFIGHPMAYGIGLALQTHIRAYGPPADAFGHAGSGGQVHGAWPTQRVGFSYMTNQLRDGELADPRSVRLLGSLYRAVTNG